MDERLKEFMSKGWSYRLSGNNYTPTDEDLQKIAAMISNSGAQSSVTLTDESTGDIYNVSITNGELTVKKVEN